MIPWFDNFMEGLLEPHTFKSILLLSAIFGTSFLSIIANSVSSIASSLKKLVDSQESQSEQSGNTKVPLSTQHSVLFQEADSKCQGNSIAP